MGVFLSLLPLYLFGNAHCFGMCGPLVMMMGSHRYRYAYFIGRMLSYTLAGALAGYIGAVVNLTFAQFHLSALTSFMFGLILLSIGLFTFLPISIPAKIQKRLYFFSNLTSLLILQNRFWPVFLFGFLTVALPCGQTLIVFSTCALYGDVGLGLLNGFTLAILTSPSLYFAMKAHHLFSFVRKYNNQLLGATAIVVGCLAIFRGLADLEYIPHWVVNANTDTFFHIVLF